MKHDEKEGGSIIILVILLLVAAFICGNLLHSLVGRSYSATRLKHEVFRTRTHAAQMVDQAIQQVETSGLQTELPNGTEYRLLSKTFPTVAYLKHNALPKHSGRSTPLAVSHSVFFSSKRPLHSDSFFPQPSWTRLAASTKRSINCRTSHRAGSFVRSSRSCENNRLYLNRSTFIRGNLVVSDKLTTAPNSEAVTRLVVRGFAELSQIQLSNTSLVLPRNQQVEIIAAGDIFVNKLTANPLSHTTFLIHSTGGRIVVSDLELPTYTCSTNDNLSLTLRAREGVLLNGKEFDAPKNFGKHFGCDYSGSAEVWPAIQLLGWE